MNSSLNAINDNNVTTNAEHCNDHYSYIGKKVIESQECHRQLVEAMTPIWKEEGQHLRTLRDNLHISRQQLSQNVGVCPQVIAKLENGKPIRSRNAIRQSCITSMKFINLQRSTALQNFES